jgi:hypothetical protein
MMEDMEGRSIVRVNETLTAAFVLSAILATVFFDQPWKSMAVVVSLVCFSVGVVSFLWGYWTAVQRSREDDISVAALYFLVDNCAPVSVARRMNSLLGSQVVCGVVTALVRSQTDGERGSTLAFGILAPMLGLGLNGLWGAQHGTFRPRRTRTADEVPPAGSGNGQD